MRTWVLGLGMLGLLVGTAGARSVKSSPYIGPGTTYREVKQHNSVFNQVKQEGVLHGACGGKTPQAIMKKRTPGDWTLAVLTLGFYTPQHANVACPSGSGPRITAR